MTVYLVSGIHPVNHTMTKWCVTFQEAVDAAHSMVDIGCQDVVTREEYIPTNAKELVAWLNSLPIAH